MKVQCSHRLDARLLEYAAYVEDNTGVDRTKLIEKLIEQDAQKVAKADPEVEKILNKTPKEFEEDKKAKRGIFSKKGK